MRRKVWIAILLLFVLGALVIWWRARDSGHYTNFPPSAAGPWVAFGDSLTSGYGAESGEDYPTLLAQRLDVPIINLGHAGETTRDAVRRVDEVARLRPRVVLLCFGGNDALQQLPTARTFENLGNIIDALHQTGAFVVLMGVRSASLLDRNRGAFKQLARQKKVFLVPDILDGVMGSPAMMSDYVHPNEAGYAEIAGRLEKVLRPLLPKLRGESSR